MPKDNNVYIRNERDGQLADYANRIAEQLN